MCSKKQDHIILSKFKLQLENKNKKDDKPQNDQLIFIVVKFIYVDNIKMARNGQQTAIYHLA